MLSRLFAALLSACLLAGFFFFSAFVFMAVLAVIVPLGIGFYIYLRWRMRDLRAVMPESDVIEAEYTIIDHDTDAVGPEKIHVHR